MYDLSLKTTFENVCLLVNKNIEANSVDPDQTVPLDLHCLPKRLQKYFSRRQKHTTFCDSRFKG